jgi:DNA-binding NtrC family response regulator
MKRVLMIDDDAAITNSFMVILAQTELYDTVVVNDSRRVSSLLDEQPFDVILLDMDMPHVSGMQILEDIRRRKLNVPVIILTGVSDVDLAVKAMKLGVYDYLIKPVDEEKLLEVLAAALQQSAVDQTINRLPEQLSREDLKHQAAFEHFPTQDPAMVRVLHKAEQMAAADVSVFIWGERGTGRGMLARAIHQAGAHRAGPYVVFHLDHVSAGQMPAALFGQARGWRDTDEIPGFLEQADKGTLFLDEVEYLSMPLQVRLLRFLQTGNYYREKSTELRQVDVRLIATSTHDLTADEYSEQFSRELLYHLTVNSLHLPPLRERRRDISLLTEYFLHNELVRQDKRIDGLAPDFIDALSRYDFPGNLHELHALIAHAVSMEDGATLSLCSLSPEWQRRLSEPRHIAGDTFRPRKLAEIEREHAMNVMDYCNRDHVRAAAELGISLDDLKRILS